MWLIYHFVVLGVVGLTLGRDIPWVKSTENYGQAEILDEKETYILFWNYNETHVTFEVHVKTRGWVGFGFSGNGDMYPADVIIGWVTDDGTTHFSNEPIITAGNEMLVHHMALYRCKDIPANRDGVSGNCYYNRPANLPSCVNPIVTWAVGGPPFDFPENVGFSIGSPDDASFYILEIHYNNPTHKAGIIDNSGIRITITDKLRPMEAGLMMVGLTLSFSLIIPPNQPAFMTRGHCSENCIRDGMAAQNISEIRIFSGIVHAHMIGTGVTTRHFRNGQELEPILQDDSYDFNFQGVRNLPEEHIVYPGDSFRVDCTYDSRRRSSVTLSGLATTDEMCTSFMYYYPRMPVVLCISRPTYNTFSPLQGTQLQYVMKKGKWESDGFMAEFERRIQMSTSWHQCTGDQYQAPSHAEIFFEKDDQTPYVAPPSACPEKQIDTEKYNLTQGYRIDNSRP